jgi:hypothetical protein
VRLPPALTILRERGGDREKRKERG